MAWPRKTLKLRVDRDLAEALIGETDGSPSPDALTRALRAHADCEQERQRLRRVTEQAGREVMALQQRYRDLQTRYDRLIQENAELVGERRRLNETLQRLRRSSPRG